MRQIIMPILPWIVTLPVLLQGCAAPCATAEPQAAASTNEPQQERQPWIAKSVVEAATKAKDVSKMKLRVAANGHIVKESVYHGDAERISESVRKLAEEKFPGAKVRSYETEAYIVQMDGGPASIGTMDVHEVEVETAEGKHCEIAAQVEGTELYTECEIAKGELPQAITDDIAELLPNAEILEAEHKETRHESVSEQYSVKASSGGRTHYLIYSGKGERTGHYIQVPAVIEVALE